MALLLQNGTDSLLLQNGVDALLLQAPDVAVIFTHDEGMLATSEADFLGAHNIGLFTHDEGLLDSSEADFLGSHLFGSFTHDEGAISEDGNFLGSHLFAQFTHDEGPISEDALFLVYTDFTAFIADGATNNYVMDLDTPSGLVRVPITSWQATLQVTEPNYVQCVIQHAEEYADDIDAATGFTISVCTLASGLEIEYVMATVETPTIQTYQSGQRYTVTLSGYSDGFAEDLNPPEVYDRTLQDIRTISSLPSGQRVRCAIDFLLIPSHRAYVSELESFIVSYINFYVTNQGGTSVDSYMDVGERV